MANFDLHTIAQVHASFADGLSPVTLVEECLQRIDAHDAALRALTFVKRDEVLEQARQAESEFRSGKARGPLHGIPIAVKDVIDVGGWPTTSGSRLFEGHTAERDAACVANLRAAGAILIGKTNLHELTAGSHDNPWFGKVVNPLDPERGTGGTSSGSAAAVAAGFCIAAIGTDTGGSNRSTAAATGLVGLKPTNGVINCTGVRPTAPTFDTIGPIARSVADARLVYNAMRGVDDPHDRDVEMDGLRIGVCPELYSAAVDPVVRAAHEAFVARAIQVGASVHDLSFPFAREVRDAGLAILLYEFAAQYRTLIEANPAHVGEAVHHFLSTAASISDETYAAALGHQSEMKSQFAQFMADVDVLATPVAPGLAPRLSDEMTQVGSALVPYGPAGGYFRRWANFFGVPTLALPLAIQSNLPASIQITTPHNTEDYLFSACQALSRLGTGSVL